MSSEQTTRRDRVVMALGICALLLFAANIITMVKKHFFDDHRTERTVVVHQTHRAPRAHFVVRPERPNIERQIRIVTRQHEQMAELVAMKARLLQEAERLSQEAKRLAADGHTDASLSLQQTVEQSMAQLRHVEQRLNELAETDFEVRVVEPRVNVEVAEPAVDVQVEVIESGSN